VSEQEMEVTQEGWTERRQGQVIAHTKADLTAKVGGKYAASL